MIRWSEIYNIIKYENVGEIISNSKPFDLLHS